MSADAAASQAARMLEALAGEDIGRRRRTVREILSWLWDTVAEPVLLALGHTGTATCAAVTAALAACTWAHLACHAGQ
ncbi:MAG TPA: hypothetical protein VHZ03_47215 [Trebonia sp.]|nr:hypothetical protein [Trebonia sp.]